MTSRGAANNGSGAKDGNVFERAFHSIAEKVVTVQKAAHQTISNSAQKVAERIMEEVTREELQVFGSQWETSETIERCRVCRVVFETLSIDEKHHCRACASVICINCSILVREEQLTHFMTQVLLPPALCPENINNNYNSSNNSRGSITGNSNNNNSLLSGAIAKVNGTRQWRFCQPCLQGHTPNLSLRDSLHKQLDKQNQLLQNKLSALLPSSNNNNNNTSINKKPNALSNMVDSVGFKLVAKVNEVVGIKDSWQQSQGAENIPLFYGSYYPDGPATNAVLEAPMSAYSALYDSTVIGYSPPNSRVPRTIPTKGYIEIVNKSAVTPYAIKVLFLPPNSLISDTSASDSSENFAQMLLFWQSNVLFEAAKPSFKVLKPKEQCFSFVTSSNGSSNNNSSSYHNAVVAVIVLHDYQESSKSLLAGHPTNASSSNNTQNYLIADFHKARVYYFDVRDRHMLLKIKEPALLLPRQGASIGRVGVFGYLAGARGTNSMLDYSNNVESNIRVFDLASSAFAS